MSPNHPPACINCRFHSKQTVIFTMHMCRRWPESRSENFDPVSGKVTAYERQEHCSDQRKQPPYAPRLVQQPDLCGPDGKYFEPLPEKQPAPPPPPPIRTRRDGADRDEQP